MFSSFLMPFENLCAILYLLPTWIVLMVLMWTNNVIIGKKILLLSWVFSRFELKSQTWIILKFYQNEKKFKVL